MRKLFLLIPAFLLSVAVNAATTNVDPGTGTLKAAISAATSGDVLELNAGTYVETESAIDIYKNLTIKAANMNNLPIIQAKGLGISGTTVGVRVKFEGIKFDAQNSGEHLLYSYDKTNSGNKLILEGCELYNFTLNKSLINCGSAYKLDSLVVNNCYFHDIMKSCIFLENSNLIGLKITNSTFVNISTNSDEYFAGIIDPRTTSGGVQVDQCTFYNCTPMSTDYGAVKVLNTTNAVVSNSIFMMPSSTALRAIHMISGNQVKNCIVYNYTASTNGIHYNVTPTNCQFVDPLFADPANNNFTPNEETSPAKGTGVGGTHLGDPRWWPASWQPAAVIPVTSIALDKTALTLDVNETAFLHATVLPVEATDPSVTWSSNNNSVATVSNGVVKGIAAGSATITARAGEQTATCEVTVSNVIPSTDFAEAYFLKGTKAALEGNIYISEADSLYYNDKSTCGTASWRLHIEKACAIRGTVNFKSSSASGTKFALIILDNSEQQVGDSLFIGYYEQAGNKDFNGSIYIPEAGDYTIKLANKQSHSSGKIKGITLSYIGGDVTDIAASANTPLNVADAWFSGCTRDNDKTYIQYPSSGTSSAWIKWNIATSETKFYDLTVNVNTEDNHGFTVTIYEDEEAEPVASVTEGSYVETKGVLALELGRLNLVGGKKYVVKVTNAPSGSQAKVTSVVFAPVVASSTALPNTLNFSNAVLSPKAHITDGMLYFNEIGDTNPQGQWAQWEVTTDHNGLFLFTMGVASTSQQSYKITIKDNSENELEYFEANPGSGNQTIKHYFALNAGTYFVKVENTYSYSNGHLTSLAVTEPAGVVTLDENATDNSAWYAKVGDNNTYDVQIIRSFRGGMNNTFCLPFAVSSAQCKEVFGNDVEIRTLDDATIEEGNFVLNLNFVTTTSIYQGTPVLIKPARDIVNPVFTGVEFKKAASEPTTKTNADFVGSFVKTPLTASDDLLYVGPENKVFFLSVDYDMPGMRAWFVIHDVPAALGSPKALRSARIIEKEQITTSILNVETSGDAARKVLYNGQIVIIRGNEMYNMQGQHIQ